jgi:cytochrome P450
MTKHKEICQKVRDEIQTVCGRKDFINLSSSEWRDLLTYEKLDDFKYLNFCMNETLRMKPPIDITTPIEMMEPITLNGIRVRTDTPIFVNITGLHRNPKEWQTPLEYIPDRFDPMSKFYTTPSGGKRHPMSYGPFLGGMRVCLGKTFAEKIVKSMLAIILS